MKILIAEISKGKVFAISSLKKTRTFTTSGLLPGQVSATDTAQVEKKKKTILSLVLDMRETLGKHTAISLLQVMMSIWFYLGGTYVDNELL